jgi:KUP system potassium uptake protein
VILYFVARRIWKWHAVAAGSLCALFLVIDLAFCSATLLKIADGGWFAFAVAIVVFTLLSTWWTGRKVLATRIAEGSVPLTAFVADPARQRIHRVPGTAVFLTGNPHGVPPALLHNVKHNKVIHETVAVVTVVTEQIPRVWPQSRSEVEELGDGFYLVTLRYGFMDSHDVPRALSRIGHPGLDFAEMKTTYFVGHNRVLARRAVEGMAVWREKLFATMARNSQDATAYFNLPSNRVIELGAQLEL